ncbi:DNA repair protein, RAD5 [Microthyrium microscopicum]|uniref:DNA repair protein, RAD5 n=1 Tax=Microthyrium microscopicum TaxID=703497 RepID=A0A6A6U5W0_9PEZI|nr:DNA repair protein, RAD5 [Microthyrium microscopicum]
MAHPELEERPAKKRRFFVDDELPPSSSTSTQSSAPLLSSNVEAEVTIKTPEIAPHTPGAFDVDLLAGIIGETLSTTVVEHLIKASDGNLERAINIYLDGSWKDQTTPAVSLPTDPSNVSEASSLSLVSSKKPARPGKQLSRFPDKRYIGSFGVAGWATRSGLGLLTFGEKIQIERAKPVAAKKPGRFGNGAGSKRNDIVVRFTNSRREEVGRLENTAAAWIASLLDQHICFLEGTCVYAPNRIKTGDDLILQLHCYLLKTAFGSFGFGRMDSNRERNIFEAQESSEERDLRLRQIALVKLFEEIHLTPSSGHHQDEGQKREGIIQVAEKITEAGVQKIGDTSKQTENDPASPSSDVAENGEELEQDQLDALYKKAQAFDFDSPEAEPASTFILSLRRYQKQALHWMIGKETASSEREESMHPLWDEYKWPVKDSDGNDLPTTSNADSFYVNLYSGTLDLEFPVQEQNCLGGILADEMGLGKTIEVLSLVHSHRDESLPPAANRSNTINDLSRLHEPTSALNVEPAPSTTLVICPMSLLSQWKSEAEKASSPGTVNVFVYYGSEKNLDLRTLCCRANSTQIPNIIITSYGTVLSQYQEMASRDGTMKPDSLFGLSYYRVVLDEAHMIKNRTSKTAKACYELKAQHRWVLSGTPIVNREQDLFSLVHFLQVAPWSNFSYWRTFITAPFESGDFLRALRVLQTVMEPLILRRTKDMKLPSGEALVPLPTRTIKIDKLELSESERDVYDFFFHRAKRTFDANADNLLKKYTTIFAQILRLRQTCCHPLLTRNPGIVADEEDAINAKDVESGLSDDMDLVSLLSKFEGETEEQDANKFGAAVLRQIQEESAVECPICCEEPMNEQTVTGCWHSACKQCILDYIQHQREKGQTPKCFNCREEINNRDLFEVVRHDGVEHGHTGTSELSTSKAAASKISLRRLGINGSTKISALLTELKKLRVQDPMTKSVVFSQFTSFLDLIEPALKRDHIAFLRFDGTMAQKQRAAVIDEFVNRRNGVVLLLSLRAGGVGLNLTAAKHVFMMDPWWSFAVEAQAIDRVHRMGQESEVHVTRFIIQGTVEERMLKIQERKRFIATSLGMMNEEEKKLQRIEDIKELLS